MIEKFSVPELTALRSELLHGLDSKDAAELIQMFLAGHGYGVSAEEARDAVRNEIDSLLERWRCVPGLRDQLKSGQR